MLRSRTHLLQIRAMTNAKYDRDVAIVIVGTHADEAPPENTNLAELSVVDWRRIYPEIVYHTTLTCRDLNQVHQLKDELVRIAQTHQMLKNPVPKSFVQLEESLYKERAKLGENRPVVSWNDFVRHAVQSRITINAAPAAARFLHNTGSVVYFDDPRSGLDTMVILDPQWLARVMSCT
jgi:hypothetical protein